MSSSDDSSASGVKYSNGTAITPYSITSRPPGGFHLEAIGVIGWYNGGDFWGIGSYAGRGGGIECEIVGTAGAGIDGAAGTGDAGGIAFGAVGSWGIG